MCLQMHSKNMIFFCKNSNSWEQIKAMQHLYKTRNEICVRKETEWEWKKEEKILKKIILNLKSCKQQYTKKSKR